MFGNVQWWKVGQEFWASFLNQKHGHHKLTEFQLWRWKCLCLTDRCVSAGGGEKNRNILSCSDDGEPEDEKLFTFFSSHSTI